MGREGLVMVREEEIEEEEWLVGDDWEEFEEEWEEWEEELEELEKDEEEDWE